MPGLERPIGVQSSLDDVPLARLTFNLHHETRYNMAELSRQELDEIYAFAVQLGKDAGQMLLDAAKLRMGDERATQEQKEHVEKENAVDLVTETDEGRSRLYCRREERNCKDICDQDKALWCLC